MFVWVTAQIRYGYLDAHVSSLTFVQMGIKLLLSGFRNSLINEHCCTFYDQIEKTEKKEKKTKNTQVIGE